jgi:pimeloyl-ACP methyl ester carboxylesterase
MCQPIAELNSHKPGFNAAVWLRGVGTAVFLPENFEPSYRYPVVVWLEASDSDFEARTWFPLITPRNAVAISLQPHGDGPTGWRTSSDDVWPALEYVGTSVAEVAAEIAVHPRRIFLAGRGDGAAMAADILCMEPERFAGAILIDPAAEAASLSLHDWRCQRRSPVLTARLKAAEIQLHRNHLRSRLEIETVSGLSKPALARLMNHWLMAQMDASTCSA